jgi:hypothetical protein
MCVFGCLNPGFTFISMPSAFEDGNQQEKPRQLVCEAFRFKVRGQCHEQGCGSGSAWIRINLSCWIRIRIQIADPDPDPGGQK